MSTLQLTIYLIYTTNLNDSQLSCSHVDTKVKQKKFVSLFVSLCTKKYIKSQSDIKQSFSYNLVFSRDTEEHKKTVNQKIYCLVEQVARIELARPGRKHGILPLNYTCISFMSIAQFSLESQDFFPLLKIYLIAFCLLLW